MHLHISYSYSQVMISSFFSSSFYSNEIVSLIECNYWYRNFTTFTIFSTVNVALWRYTYLFAIGLTYIQLAMNAFLFRICLINSNFILVLVIAHCLTPEDLIGSTVVGYSGDNWWFERFHRKVIYGPHRVASKAISF